MSAAHYAAGKGREILSVASMVPDQLLQRGLDRLGPEADADLPCDGVVPAGNSGYCESVTACVAR